MTLPKGFIKISIQKKTDAKLNSIRRRMISAEPDEYDEKTSYNDVIEWLIQQARR